MLFDGGVVGHRHVELAGVHEQIAEHGQAGRHEVPLEPFDAGAQVENQRKSKGDQEKGVE